MTLISVVIPVYRTQEQLLERCLDSILGQSQETEVWLIFDGDESNCPALIRRFLDRGMDLHYEICGHNGVSAARNRGIANASGTWITFVDADDWLEKDALPRLCEAAKKWQADIVMAEYWTEYGERRERHAGRKENTLFQGEKKKDFVKDVLKPQTGAGFAWGKLFCREFLIAQGLLFCEELSMAEDAEFMFRAAAAAERIVYLKRPLYHYWYHAGSVVRSYCRDYAGRYQRAMQELRSDLDIVGDAGYEDAYNGCVAYHLLLIAVNGPFHPEFRAPLREKIREFREVTQEDIFKTALGKVPDSEFSGARRAAYFCIRKHWYLLVYLIAGIRHWQARHLLRK